MTTKAKPTPAPAAAADNLKRLTLALSRPIADDAGQSWSTLTFSEPDLGARMAAERETTSEVAQVTRLFAELSGVPETAIAKLKTPDARKVNAWLDALGDDDDATAPTVEGDRHTFTLLCPIVLDGQEPIKTITLREPDLAAGIAVERFKRRHEITAATIAALSGLTIPVVSRLKMRDAGRVEAWLIPFVADTDSTADLGAI